jgi:hypothetical protein
MDRNKYRPINFLCDADTYKRFKIKCVEQSTTLANVLRRLIFDFLKEENNEYTDQDR